MFQVIRGTTLFFRTKILLVFGETFLYQNDCKRFSSSFVVSWSERNHEHCCEKKQEGSKYEHGQCSFSS